MLLIALNRKNQERVAVEDFPDLVSIVIKLVITLKIVLSQENLDLVSTVKERATWLEIVPKKGNQEKEEVVVNIKSPASIVIR